MYSKDELLNKKEIAELLNAVVTYYDLSDVDYDDSNRPLSNMLVALKDNISTKDIRTTASSRSLDNYVPIYDATIVEKLVEAGAIFYAKTSMDELGMGGSNLHAYTGPVKNPYDLNRVSGGSSGGSAALVSSGVVPMAIGTDTGDSVRKPASYCGVVGFKPTYGRISRWGVIPYASSLDHVGFFTRNIKDSALLLEVLSGRDDRDMTSSNRPVEKYTQYMDETVTGKTIGILKNVYDLIDADLKNDFDKLIDSLKAQGYNIKMVEVDDELLISIFVTYYVIANAEATSNHSNIDGIKFGVREDGNTVDDIMVNSRTKGFSINTRKRMVFGGYSLNEENYSDVLLKAQKIRRLIVDEFKQKFEEVDFIMAPAHNQKPQLINETPNPNNDKQMIIENFMVFANFNGYPSITVPFTMIDDLPYGVNITGLPFTEKQLLRVSQSVEDSSDMKDKIAQVTQ